MLSSFSASERLIVLKYICFFSESTVSFFTQKGVDKVLIEYWSLTFHMILFSDSNTSFWCLVWILHTHYFHAVFSTLKCMCVTFLEHWSTNTSIIFSITWHYFDYMVTIQNLNFEDAHYLLFPGMNIFVAFFLLLKLLAHSTPPGSSSIPLIGNVLSTGW